jgi:hypothetical protein
LLWILLHPRWEWIASKLSAHPKHWVKSLPNRCTQSNPISWVLNSDCLTAKKVQGFLKTWKKKSLKSLFIWTHRASSKASRSDTTFGLTERSRCWRKVSRQNSFLITCKTCVSRISTREVSKWVSVGLLLVCQSRFPAFSVV